MKDFEFIIRNGRYRITFWDLFPIIIILSGIFGLEFVLSIIINSLSNKLIVLFCSIVLATFFTIYFFHNLLKVKSFKSFHNSSINSIENIIINISTKFNLQLYRQNNHVYKMSYFLPNYYYLTLFKTKKVVTIITVDSSILINIGNFNLIKTTNFFRDKKSSEILSYLEKEIKDNAIEKKYNILKPSLHLSKN